MNPCPDHESRIALAAGGDLTPPEAAALEAHLRSCDACRRFAEEIDDSQRAVRGLAEQELGDDVLTGVRAAVLREIASSRQPGAVVAFPGAGWRTARPWLAAAAGVLLALGALALFQRVPGPEPAGETGLESRGSEKVASTSAPEPQQPPAEIQPSPVASSTALPTPEVTTRASADPPPAAAPTTPRKLAPPIASPPPATAPPPPTAETETVLAQVVPPPETALAAHAGGAAQTAPTVIKLIPEDADLVIYWLVPAPATTNEETTDAISTI